MKRSALPRRWSRTWDHSFGSLQRVGLDGALAPVGGSPGVFMASPSQVTRRCIGRQGSQYGLSACRNEVRDEHWKVHGTISPEGPMSTDVSRVAVIGDCAVYRYGLARVIDSAPDLEFTIGARSVDEAEGELESSDVVLLDLQQPQGVLSATVSRLAARGVMVMVVYAAPPSDIAASMRAGARGCLSRQAGEEELLAAIRLLAARCEYISAVLAVGPRPCPDPPCRVTKREREILELA